jgi:transglutaminase-like putative cysteine protease
MGEVITISGENFGPAREESYITIAGTEPTDSSYYTWEDDFIMVRVPEFGEPGLVFVYVNGRKSNGILFSNIAAIPRLVDAEDIGLKPRIISISPKAGPVGALVTITGNNFGGSRENGGVFFSWDYETPSLGAPLIRAPEFIEASENELGYEFWSTREIRVRVPDGAKSGNLEVHTTRGKSQSMPFTVSGSPGTKTFEDKRVYIINYSVDVRILEASRPNTLYLWMPQPVTSPSQRNITLLSRSIDPFTENYRGANLFKIDNLAAGANAHVDLSYSVEVYVQKTNPRIQSIVPDENSFLAEAYSQSSNLIPSNNPQIKRQVNAIISRERNPYSRARLIYDWLIREIKITETTSSDITWTNWPESIVEALEKKQADPATAVLLYCAMARAGELPCIPAAGVLVNRNRQTIRHYWAEFWINGFGWIPVDPVMGAGAVPPSFMFEQVPGFYFGNLDNQRIVFSRGEPGLTQIESRGRPISRSHSYSLQNIWEEASGGIESYSSLWGDVIITGVYVQ